MCVCGCVCVCVCVRGRGKGGALSCNHALLGRPPHVWRFAALDIHLGYRGGIAAPRKMPTTPTHIIRSYKTYHAILLRSILRTPTGAQGTFGWLRKYSAEDPQYSPRISNTHPAYAILSRALRNTHRGPAILSRALRNTHRGSAMLSRATRDTLRQYRILF